MRIEVGENLGRILSRIYDPTTKRQLSDIKEILQNIMGKQEDYDAQIAAANTALDGIAAAVAAEAKQIAEFIAANPSVNTSALAGVVTRLEAADEAIGTVFEPATEPTPAPEPEPTPEPVP